MTMSDEQPRLSAILSETAQSFDPPDLDILCERAVHHGRRTIARRRAFGAGIGVVALTGVALGTTATITGSHPAHTTVPVVTVSNESLSEYMAKNFMALLPAGITLIEDGAVPLTGEGLRMGPSNGDWEASASVFAMYQGKKVTFNLSVVQQAADRECITQLPASSYNCTSTTIDGHTLLSEESINGGTQFWTYTWNLGGGKAVQLGVDDKLSGSLVERVLTAPAWTSVLRALPAYVDCPTLEQYQAKTGGWLWKCPTTGKTYPVQSSDNYLYPSS
jgi:hypothetical protein